MTTEAYKMGYDKHQSVLLETYLWEEHLYATLKKKKILKEKGFIFENDKNYLSVMDDYIQMLQKKYSDQIEINFKQFDKINLSHIDMVAIKPSAAYSHPVPPFPIMTSDHNIDYGKKISH